MESREKILLQIQAICERQEYNITVEELIPAGQDYYVVLAAPPPPGKSNEDWAVVVKEIAAKIQGIVTVRRVLLAITNVG